MGSLTTHRWRRAQVEHRSVKFPIIIALHRLAIDINSEFEVLNLFRDRGQSVRIEFVYID